MRGLLGFWNFLPDTLQITRYGQNRIEILKYNSKASQRRIFHKNILIGFLEIWIFSRMKLFMWPGECSGSKKFISFLKSFLRHRLTILNQKVSRKCNERYFSAIWNWIFFFVKKHYFWNFSSPASKKFFLENPNMPFDYKLKTLQNGEKLG